MISNQIEAFERCDEELGPKPMDFNNLSHLFEDLKQHALKIDEYPQLQLLMILQKLSSISSKSLFISFEELVKQMKEIQEKDADFVIPINLFKN